MRAYRSPRRFAVCCVLLLLIMPRHSPYALCNLITYFNLMCESHQDFLRFELFFCFSFQIICTIFLKSSFTTSIRKTFLCLICFSFICYSVFKERPEVSFDPSKLNRIYFSKTQPFTCFFLLRKEVIHPHVPVGIPCYDLTPVISSTLGASLLCRLG